jgi:hypothetical protein
VEHNQVGAFQFLFKLHFFPDIENCCLFGISPF